MTTTCTRFDSKPGDKAQDTGAVEQCGGFWGFMTLTIDKDEISGVTVEIDRGGNTLATKDSFSYPAAPIQPANPKSVPTL